MLNKRKADFASMVWAAVPHCGRNAPKIADFILRATFPRTCEEAEHEGADKMLRTGVITEIKRILRLADDDVGQTDFAEISPQFRPIVSKLKSKSYFVESLNEYVPVPRLIAEPDLLTDAQQFMRRKGMECLAEARTLEELREAVAQDRQPDFFASKPKGAGPIAEGPTA